MCFGSGGRIVHTNGLAQSLLVVGAVRAESYGYFESQIVKNVVLDGKHVDLVDSGKEFTDWEQLRTAVDAFIDLPA